ncbi:hypothetical protein [Actinoplanes sp. HUAS TT8]|uniref:hypothetical protein n=1 Tax=Actinoplanes sp. HUAS TT8 TaxID=3447453 RepID=UPI003F51F3AA
MPDVLIDLGVVPDEPAAIPPRPRRQYLRPLAAVVAAGLLFLLGGAATATRPAPPKIVAAAVDGRVVVRANRLFVVDAGRPVGAPERQQVIHAYSLPDVRPLFDQTVTVSGEIIDVRPVSDDLLLVEERSYTQAARSIIAIRPGTAEPLWRRDGILVGVTPGGPAVFGADILVGDDADGPVEWTGVDLATGATTWTVTKSAGERALPDTLRGDPRWLYVLRAGRLTSYDMRDGRPAAEVPLPGLRPDTSALWPLGDRLLVSSDATGTTIFSTAAGLTPSAHTVHSLAAYLDGYPCGELICAYAAGGGLTGIDPATLADKWSVEHAEYSLWMSGYLFAIEETTSEPRIRRSDPVTGRDAGQLDGWTLAAATSEDFYVRHKEDGGRLWFGLLDPARLRVRPLLAADGVTDECLIADDVLVCRKIDANVGVWRLR